MATIPEIFVLGGPNGAGKTTTAMVLLPEDLHVKHFVNADMIAQELSPGAPEQSAIEAGRLMLKRIHELRAQKVSFAFETTLASRTLARFLREAQIAGYSVHVIYVWVESVRLAQSRVLDRVRLGGHNVPPEDVERRYWRGLRNFFSIYRPLANSWTICNNTERNPVVVARGWTGESPTVFDSATYQRIQNDARI